MSGGERLQGVLPTRMALTALKQQHAGAKRGHLLLKRKSDALNMRFRDILSRIVQSKESMGEVLSAASFSWAEAKCAAPCV